MMRVGLLGYVAFVEYGTAENVLTIDLGLERNIVARSGVMTVRQDLDI